MSSRLKIGHLILIFAMVALPFAATFAFYYPDERHYTDGALGMLKDHDWLIPKNANGSPRFEKPPLAYWTIAASYKILGVSVFASRVPFLLASCGTLFLTFRLARKLTGNAETALLAAIVLLSHPQFFLCSVRSIPDALLVFFVTLSAYGFLRLIVFEEFVAGAFWAAYGGAALAVMCKGLLGVGIVGFAWAFVAVKEHDWRAVKKMIHLPIFIAATILAGSWFACIFWKDGATTWRVFFGDQVTGNMQGHFWSPLERVALFALIFLFNFLPWSATAVEFLARRKVLKPGNVPPPAKNFIFWWAAVLILGFSLGANVSLRYLLPATPLVAILIADCLQRSESVHLIFSVRRILKIILAALILMDAAAFYIDSQWPLPAIVTPLTCGLFLFGIIALGLGALWRKSFPAVEALGLAILLFWLMFFSAATPVLLPDRAQQIAATLLQTQVDASKPILLVGNLQLASRVRVLLGKSWTVVQHDKLNPADLKDYTDILVPEKEIYQFVNHGWQIQTAAVGNSVPPFKELWSALKSRTLPQVLAPPGQKICLAARG
jgi:4-amino-4-deoxy-L-arabinose transferase-like glycosyltransferase